MPTWISTPFSHCLPRCLSWRVPGQPECLLGGRALPSSIASLRVNLSFPLFFQLLPQCLTLEANVNFLLFSHLLPQCLIWRVTGRS
jgi:hypothetical protein